MAPDQHRSGSETDSIWLGSKNSGNHIKEENWTISSVKELPPRQNIVNENIGEIFILQFLN